MKSKNDSWVVKIWPLIILPFPEPPSRKPSYQTTTSFSAPDTIHFMMKLQKLLMIHQDCHPAHLQLNIGFLTNFHVSQCLRNYTKKVHVYLPKLWHYTNGPKFPNKTMENQQNKHWASAGAHTNHQLQDRYVQRCPTPVLCLNPSPTRCFCKTSWAQLMGWKKRWGQQLHPPWLRTQENTVEPLFKQELTTMFSCNRQGGQENLQLHDGRCLTAKLN